MTTSTQTWRGVVVDQRTADMLEEAARLVGQAAHLRPTSGSYVDLPVMAGTHKGGGAVNLSGLGHSPWQRTVILEALRKVGFAAWWRGPGQTLGPPYFQLLAVGCADLSAQAQAQVRAYLEGRNGLPDNGLDVGPRDWVNVTWETYLGQAS